MKICIIGACDRQAFLKQMCRAHYARDYRGMDMEKPLRRVAPDRGCSVAGCSEPHKALGLCNFHYERQARGTALDAPHEKKRVRWEPRGDWFLDPHGYICKSMRNDKGVSRVVYQHRAVMEEAIGRALLPSESVHHKNGQRDDNRLANLELWSKAQPAGQRVEDKVTFALELLALYAPERLVDLELAA